MCGGRIEGPSLFALGLLGYQSGPGHSLRLRKVP